MSTWRTLRNRAISPSWWGRKAAGPIASSRWSRSKPAWDRATCGPTPLPWSRWRSPSHGGVSRLAFQAAKRLNLARDRDHARTSERDPAQHDQAGANLDVPAGESQADGEYPDGQDQRCIGVEATACRCESRRQLAQRLRGHPPNDEIGGAADVEQKNYSSRRNQYPEAENHVRMFPLRVL